MYQMEVSRALLTRISKIMRPMRTWAFLASLTLLATIVGTHHIHGYKPPPPSHCDYNTNENIQRAISSGAEVVTYGEPCFCKESIPYSIQVPKHSIVEHPKVEKLGTYGYAVDAMPTEHHQRRFQLPMRIETPVIEHRPQSDYFRGKTYGVMVQHQEHRPGPRRFNFDCAVQKPVRVEKSYHTPSMSILIQKQEKQIHPRFSPLPIDVQTPILPETKRIESIRFNPLSATVDRVLVPACEINACPDCNDILPKKHSHSHSHRHSYSHSPSPLPPIYSPSC